MADGTVQNQVGGPNGTTTTRFTDGTVTTQRGNGDATVRGTAQVQRDGQVDTGTIRDGGDECAVSAGINAKYSCNGTRAMVDGARVTNMVTQVAGSMATQVAGQSATMQAQQSGTQADAMHAAASVQRTSGDIQLVTGGINATMGIAQIVMGMGHKSDGKKIDGDTTSFSNQNQVQIQSRDITTMTTDGKSNAGGNIHGYVQAQAGSVSNDIINNARAGDMNSKYRLTIVGAADTPQMQEAERARRISEAQVKEQEIRSAVVRTGTAAAGEQKRMGNEAMMGGVMSLAQGAGQMMNGGFNIAAANKMDQIADKLNQLENMGGAPGYQPLGQMQNNTDSLAPRGSNTISGNGTTEDKQGATDDSTKDDQNLGDLGRPVGTPQNGGGPGNAPTAGKFTPGGAGAPGGGPSDSGLSGASTAPATASNDPDPSARMADNRGAPSFEGGGSYQGGGGGGGKGAEGGPDLSSLLAQFLPKKAEEEKNQNGILDFGGRSPASEGPISLLDKNANIFDRIHETYQDKNRHGNVGL